MKKKGTLKIIFYDGDCGLCQRSVVFLSKRDQKKILYFAPLNGTTYQKHFKEKASMDTVLFLKGDRVFEKSTAIIECLNSLGGVNRIVGLLKLLPREIRDWFYDHVASNRNKSACVIIAKDERFLS